MKTWHALLLVLFFSCQSKPETVFPQRENLSESVYASGTIKAKDQYQAFVNGVGTVKEVLVKEGDLVQKGTPILTVFNEATKLNRESAELARAFADRQENQAKLKDLELNIGLAKSKYENDSLLLERQKRLYSEGIGTLLTFEQRQLAFENSRATYLAAKLKYADLKRELEFNEKNAGKNLAISRSLENELVLKSDLEGKVYAILKEKGEMVTAQTPLAVIGSAREFILDMQVDEYDIVKIKEGQKVLVGMDSYRGDVFEAVISRVNPLMDERSKSFTVEGVFVNEPPVLYPNLTLEANIIIQFRENTLTLPRSYILDGDRVISKKGDTLSVQVGVRDFQKVEILGGLDEKMEVIKPGK